MCHCLARPLPLARCLGFRVQLVEACWWVWRCRQPPTLAAAMLGFPYPSNTTLSCGPAGFWYTPTPLPGPQGSSCHLGAYFGQRRAWRRWVVQQFLPGQYKGKTNRKHVRVHIHAHAHVRAHVHAHVPPGAVWAAGVAAGDALGMATKSPPTPGPLGHPRTMPSSAQPGRSPWPLLDAGIRAMAFQLEEWWQSQCVLRCHLPLSLCAPEVPMVAQTWLWSPGTSHPSRTGCSWASASRGEQHHPTDPMYTRMQRGPWGEGDACQESLARRAGSGWGKAVCIQGPGGGCNLSPSRFGHPGTCRTMRLKQASMRGWQAEKNIVFTRRKHWAPQGQGRGLRGARNMVGSGSVTHSWGVRGPIQPLPPSTGAKNKHPSLSHPQEHPSVPRSILGVGALCPLGTSVGE